MKQGCPGCTLQLSGFSGEPAVIVLIMWRFSGLVDIVALPVSDPGAERKVHFDKGRQLQGMLFRA